MPLSSSPSRWTTIADQLWLVGVAFAGGYFCDLLNVPAAWVSGSMLAVVASAAIRPIPELAPSLRDFAMVMSGTTMGSSVTPETLAAIATFPVSFVALVLSMATTVIVSSAWLVILNRWKRVDALLASAPGALSTVLAIAADRRADVVRIAVVQSLRVFALVAILPSLLAHMDGVTGAQHAIQPVFHFLSPQNMAVVMLGGLFLGLLLARVRMAAALLFGAAVFSSFLHGSGMVDGRLPPSLSIVGFVLIGAFMGGRMRGIDLGELRVNLVPGTMLLVLGMIVASAFAALAAYVSGVRFGSALLAFAPGGLEAMMVLSLALDLDPLYVGAHHIARFLGIGLILPILVMWLERSKFGGKPPETGPAE